MIENAHLLELFTHSTHRRGNVVKVIVSSLCCFKMKVVSFRLVAKNSNSAAILAVPVPVPPVVANAVPAPVPPVVDDVAAPVPPVVDDVPAPVPPVVDDVSAQARHPLQAAWAQALHSPIQAARAQALLVWQLIAVLCYQSK